MKNFTPSVSGTITPTLVQIVTDLLQNGQPAEIRPLEGVTERLRLESALGAVSLTTPIWKEGSVGLRRRGGEDNSPLRANAAFSPVNGAGEEQEWKLQGSFGSVRQAAAVVLAEAVILGVTQARLGAENQVYERWEVLNASLLSDDDLENYPHSDYPNAGNYPFGIINGVCVNWHSVERVGGIWLCADEDSAWQGVAFLEDGTHEIVVWSAETARGEDALSLLRWGKRFTPEYRDLHARAQALRDQARTLEKQVREMLEAGEIARIEHLESKRR